MNALLSSCVAEKPRPYLSSKTFQPLNLTTVKAFDQGLPENDIDHPTQAAMVTGFPTGELYLYSQRAAATTMVQAMLYLMDGSSVLDVWPKNFRRLPSIGDFISIESPECGILRGYNPQARITMIEPEPGGRTRIYLGAEVRSKSATRTVVFLNEGHIPRYWRRTVENHLRKHLELPIFGWISNNQPQPIIRVLATPAFSEERLKHLRDEIRSVMDTTEAAVR